MEALGDGSILLSVKHNGACKLVSIKPDTSFLNIVNLITAKWPYLISHDFNLVCIAGSHSNVCLDCEEDLKNLISLCSIFSYKLVFVEIIHKSNDDIPSLVGQIPSHPPPPPRKATVTQNDNHGQSIDFDGAFELPAYDISPDLIKDPLLSDDWVNIFKGGVGTVFRGGKKQFVTDLVKFTTRTGFIFNFARNDKKYVNVLCSQHHNGCRWFINAKLDRATNFFVIAKLNLIHKCVGKLIGNDTRRFISRVISNFVLAEVKENPSFSGKSVAKLIKKSYGIEVPYWKAYRAVEMAKSQTFGKFKESYNELRWYCDAIQRTNPGSVVKLETNRQTNQFERLFLAYKSSIDGFLSCRPMLFIDGTFMKGRAKGILLSATAKDGDNGLFPVAIALVSSENNSNWQWFLEHVRDSIRHRNQIFYISDRHVGIMSAFPKVFSEPVHFFCLYHLLTNLKGRFSTGWTNTKREELGGQFRACAYAPNSIIFESKLAVFLETGGAIASKWIEDLPREKWAVAYSPHITRYGEMTSNAESFNSWLKNARELPVTHMLDHIRDGISSWIVSRRAASISWSSAFVDSKEHVWNRYWDAGLWLNVVLCPSGVFSVNSRPSVVVNLEKRTCSCHRWQISGFPCFHSVAVIRINGTSVYNHVDECFFADTYRTCYSHDLHPIPDTEKHEFVMNDQFPKILPPILNCRPGRPKRTRNPSYGEYRKRTKFICPRCGKNGRHNLISCRMTHDIPSIPSPDSSDYYPTQEPVDDFALHEAEGSVCDDLLNQEFTAHFDFDPFI